MLIEPVSGSALVTWWMSPTLRLQLLDVARRQRSAGAQAQQTRLLVAHEGLRGLRAAQHADQAPRLVIVHRRLGVGRPARSSPPRSARTDRTTAGSAHSRAAGTRPSPRAASRRGCTNSPSSLAPTSTEVAGSLSCHAPPTSEVMSPMKRRRRAVLLICRHSSNWPLSHWPPSNWPRLAGCSAAIRAPRSGRATASAGRAGSGTSSSWPARDARSRASR